MNDIDFTAIVVGRESLDNLRLANALRKFIGSDNVFRYLEVRHCLEYLATATTGKRAIGIFFDLFSLPIDDATQAIGYIRDQYPEVVFCLYVSDYEYNHRLNDLPSKWQTRLRHYYRLYKAQEDSEFEPLAKHALNTTRALALTNIDEEPIRVSQWEDEFTSPAKTSDEQLLTNNMIFISYSHRNWDKFVSPLVNRLRDKGFSIWVDQHLLLGGDDWIDQIGEALDKCKVLILVMTPESLDSRFVKMEYRYFFTHDKPIVPILYQNIERLPPELSSIQHVDFTRKDTTESFAQLIDVIERNLNSGNTNK